MKIGRGDILVIVKQYKEFAAKMNDTFLSIIYLGLHLNNIFSII